MLCTVGSDLPFGIDVLAIVAGIGMVHKGNLHCYSLVSVGHQPQLPEPQCHKIADVVQSMHPANLALMTNLNSTDPGLGSRQLVATPERRHQCPQTVIALMSSPTVSSFCCNLCWQQGILQMLPILDRASSGQLATA